MRLFLRPWRFRKLATPTDTRTGGEDEPETEALRLAPEMFQAVFGDRAGSPSLTVLDATPAGVLLGSGKLATALDRLDLIAGHGPILYQGGLPSTRRLELVAAKPLRSGAVAMHYRRAGRTSGEAPLLRQE